MSTPLFSTSTPPFGLSTPPFCYILLPFWYVHPLPCVHPLHKYVEATKYPVDRMVDQLAKYEAKGKKEVPAKLHAVFSIRQSGWPKPRPGRPTTLQRTAWPGQPWHRLG